MQPQLDSSSVSLFSLLQKLSPEDQRLDSEAVAVAGAYRRSEAMLMELVQQVDRHRLFMKLGFASLFEYVLRRLQLSEGVAFNLIAVARKAREVPALKQAIASGELTVARARKIAPVLNTSNQETWIQAAKSLPKRELEAEVAKVSPFARTPERVKPVAVNRSVVTFGASDGLSKKIARAQDLLSQKRGRGVSLEQLFEAALDLFLERQDPVQKAIRAVRKANRPTHTTSSVVAQGYPPIQKVSQVGAKPSSKGDSHSSARSRPHPEKSARAPIPQAILHAVNLRDQRRCTFQQDGRRCGSTRHLHYHHQVPVAWGGVHSVENLVTLCSTHHDFVHRVLLGKSAHSQYLAFFRAGRFHPLAVRGQAGL